MPAARVDLRRLVLRAKPEAAHLVDQPLLHRRRHELVHFAPEHRDLAHEGAADELVLVAGREEHRLHLGHQVAVHAGQLEFVVEVGHRPHAAHHGLAATVHHEVAHQSREALDGDLRVFGQRLARHVDALLQREQRLLVVPGRHGDDQLAEQLRRPPDHVLMAQGHGIEGTRVDGDDVVGHGISSRRRRLPGFAAEHYATGRNSCPWTAPAMRWRTPSSPWRARASPCQGVGASR